MAGNFTHSIAQPVMERKARVPLAVLFHPSLEVRGLEVIQIVRLKSSSTACMAPLMSQEKPTI